MMRLLNIFKKKPFKRIELKVHSKDSKARIRASRTGGINAAIHPLRGLTFNTKHGMRVSKTFKGLTLGVQGKSSVVRGRWTSKNGLFNLNLSKSGFTFSSKSEYGTYNISKPNRSSFKFGGVQLRGKKAAPLAGFFFLMTIGEVVMMPILRFLFNAVRYLILLSINILIYILTILLKAIPVIYHLILFLIIDVPKQVINNVSQKETVDLTNKGDTKINEDQLLVSQKETVDLAKAERDKKINEDKLLDEDKSTLKALNETLESYGRNYSEITIFEKIYKSFFGLVGLSLYLFFLGGVFTLISFFEDGEGAFKIVILSIVLVSCILVGRLALKSLTKIMRHKRDYDLKKILEEKIEMTKENRSSK